MSANQMQRMRSILFVDKRMDFRRSPPRERPMACFFSSFFRQQLRVWEAWHSASQS
jgi:hypothetical protein